MPTRLETNFPRTLNAVEFESLVRDLCAEEWCDPYTEKNGRSGQKQHGVDVYGRPTDLSGMYFGAQCKLRTTNEQLSRVEIEHEVSQAKQFPHQLASLIIVTDTLRDNSTQFIVNQIRDATLASGGFHVAIWFWDDITVRLAAYPKLIRKYYQDIYVNLTTLPIMERLVDKSLQIFSFTQHSAVITASLEEQLALRGIRILRSIGTGAHSIPNLFDMSPDGILFQYGVPKVETDNLDLTRFANRVSTVSRSVEPDCPTFVVLPSHLVSTFSEKYHELVGNTDRIIILESTPYPAELADYLLEAVFLYGYFRRGGVPTLNISVSTLESRSSSVFLDLNWCTRLSNNRFPTADDWHEVIVPAILAVKRLVLGQSDKMRIQFLCQLPLPAAFALGFYFSIREARVGVWARKTGVSDFRQQFWLSDGVEAAICFEPIWLQEIQSRSRTAIVELTNYVGIHDAVKEYTASAEIVFDSYVNMPLLREGHTIENLDESHAIAYANQVAQLVRYLNEQGILDIHLFARIPSALALLIGQRLVACGRIHLYWFDNPTYRSAFTLS